MQSKIIEIGFSPCPNDTFIFDAMVNGKIDTGHFKFVPVLEDVQTLNQWALEDKLPITKLSYGVLPKVLKDYHLMKSGGALGRGVGPLLIKNSADDISVENAVIAIPGEHTTAHFLFQYAYPNAKNKVFLRYDEIENFVLSGKGLGVIIHENRFTYRDKDLHLVKDLGTHWEEHTGAPIPLGGIVIRKSIPEEVQVAINDCIKRSVQYAFDQLPTLSEMVKQNAMEMEERIMRQHIDLYVNEFSVDLGEEGKKAIEEFMRMYTRFNQGVGDSLRIVG